MKRILAAALACLLLTACTPAKKYEKHSGTFFGTFDTVVQFVAYTETEEEFNRHREALESTFQELHKLFDNYNTYEGVPNLRTINDNAGKAPVHVDARLIELLKSTLEREKTLSAKTSVTSGALFQVWHKVREEVIDNGQPAYLPDEAALQEAARHKGAEHIVIDEAAGTVFIDDPLVQIDLGAVAKGYATEYAAKKLAEEGLESGIINSGGNVRTIGKPMDERARWGIGISNPDYVLGESTEENAEVVYVADQSVVTSGDYQRFFTMDGERYHHLIDPDTHWPPTHFRSVTIVTKDSGLADFLSTAVFLTDYESGRKLVESLDGVEALWILPDGTKEFTEGMRAISYSQGAHATD